MIDDFDFSQESIDAEMENLQDELEMENENDVETDMEAADAALAGAYMMDIASPDEIGEISESADQMQEISDLMGVAMERTIVRMDRKGRYKHLLKQAQLNAARKANDPLYRKLEKLWTQERALEVKIQQRYASKARKIANQQIKQYAANGKRIAKPHSSTLSYKDKASTRVAQKAVGNAKKMFSSGNQKSSLNARRR